jgi:hypothetical protein
MLPTRFIFSQKAKQQTDFTADGVLRQFLQSGNDIAKKCTRKVRGIKLPEKNRSISRKYFKRQI